MKYKIAAVVGVVIFCSWTFQNKNEIKKAEWLIGTWENKTSKGSIYETWYKVNDYELSGKSYILKENDTVVFENIRLVQEHDKLYYIPVVKNQNNNLPIRFSGITATETQLIFENTEHDFPQKIAYSKIKSDSLYAEISGIKKGQPRKQAFLMKRVK